MKMIYAAAALAVALSSPADAARIWKSEGVIYINGDIELSDFENFKKIATNMPSGTMVALKSDGGLLYPALDIGLMIRAKKFRTLAFDMCASACAYLWLAGVQRGAFSDAEIGFHAVYDTSKGNAESGSGNAVLGAYLARLGFSYSIISQLTSVGAKEMNWLNFERAPKLGIAMVVVPTKKKAPPPVATAPTPEVKIVKTKPIPAYEANE